MSWTFDAPSGTYKNHALSNSIREAAVADSQLMAFLSPEPGYGKGKGDTVTITRFHNLPLASTVSELDKLPEGKPVVDTKAVTVSEWGYKVPMTNFEKTLSHYDITNKTHRALKNQMRLTMDKMAATAFKDTQYKIRSTSATAYSTATNGTFDGTAQNNLAIAHLRDIHDLMSGTLKIPRWSNGKYVGIMSTKCARGIKNDSTYETWLSPTTSEPHITGRMKDIEGFMLLETNHFDALAELAGASTATGDAIFFGEDAGFLAVVEEPELRREIATDLGRHYYEGWVGILEAGNTWGDDANNNRVVHWGSA